MVRTISNRTIPRSRARAAPRRAVASTPSLRRGGRPPRGSPLPEAASRTPPGLSETRIPRSPKELSTVAAAMRNAASARASSKRRLDETNPRAEGLRPAPSRSSRGHMSVKRHSIGSPSLSMKRIKWSTALRRADRHGGRLPSVIARVVRDAGTYPQCADAWFPSW
jgi:hypothetical protein